VVKGVERQLDEASFLFLSLRRVEHAVMTQVLDLIDVVMPQNEVVSATNKLALMRLCRRILTRPETIFANLHPDRNLAISSLSSGFENNPLWFRNRCSNNFSLDIKWHFVHNSLGLSSAMEDAVAAG